MEKMQKNSSAYRESLLIVRVSLMINQPDHSVTTILLMHTEIQETLNKTDEHRSTISILHLQILCFQHVMLLKTSLQGKLMMLTSWKFFKS